MKHNIGTPRAHIIDTGPKFDAKTTFELGPFRFHPPIHFPQMYVMLVCLMGGNTHTVKTLWAAGAELNGWTAEGYEQLGPKHTRFIVRPTVDGELTFIVHRDEAPPDEGHTDEPIQKH